MADRLAAQRAEQRVDMLGDGRAWIDDRHRAMAHDIGAGAGEGEGAGIACDNAPDQRRDRLEHAMGDIEVAAELDLGHRF
jgi:hypothetical protein